MASLIAYFSRRGNNYVNGEIKNLSIGNTEIAAALIHDMTGADLFQIEPAVPQSHGRMRPCHPRCRCEKSK